MKNMKKYYGLTRVLCVAVIGGIFMNSMINASADEKRGLKASEVLVKNLTGGPVVISLVPTDKSSNGAILKTPEGYGDHAETFAKAILQLVRLQTGEEVYVKVFRGKNDVLYVWVAAGNREGFEALKDAVYQKGALHPGSSVFAYKIADSEHVTLEAIEHRVGPFKVTAKGPVMGAIAKYLKKGKDTAANAAEGAKDRILYFKDITEDTVARMFDTAKTSAVDAAVSAKEAAVNAKDYLADKASYVADKAVAAKDYVAGKAGDAKDYVVAKAGDAKEYVAEKMHLGAEKASQKADEVANKASQKADEVAERGREAAARGREAAREVRAKMTVAEAGKVIGLTPDKIRKLEDNKTLTKRELKVLAAEIRASVEKARIDGRKNAEIAGAAFEEHLGYLENALNS